MWPCARAQATSLTLFDKHFFAGLSGRVGRRASWNKISDTLVYPPRFRPADVSASPRLRGFRSGARGRHRAPMRRRDENHTGQQEAAPKAILRAGRIRPRTQRVPQAVEIAVRLRAARRPDQFATPSRCLTFPSAFHARTDHVSSPKAFARPPRPDVPGIGPHGAPTLCQAECRRPS